MSRHLLRYLLAGLCLFVYTEATAQSRPSVDDRPGGRRDREWTETIRRVDRERQAQARAWAAARRQPLRVRQRDGRTVQLVGVTAERRPVYLTPLNARAAQVTGTRALHPGQSLGLNLTGAGLYLGVWDAGIALVGHQEFQGRVVAVDDAPVDDHATHVSGTLVAGGIRPEARGMAYGATLRSHDWEADATEMDAEAASGMLVSNHSYGIIAGWFYGDIEDDGVDKDQWYWFGNRSASLAEDVSFGQYQIEAAQYDRVTSDHPYYLPVVAAGNDRTDAGPATGTFRGLDAQGNWRTYTVVPGQTPRDGGDDGFDTIAGAATAKNVLTVASIGTSTVNGTRVSGFSSFGPMDDGRLKPDLAGMGENLFSTISEGPAQYGYSSGTSMATPNVTGTLLLLQQHYHNLTGRYLLAATLKGLALHTARDLGNPGPDYQTGWGLLDAAAAATHLTASATGRLEVQERVLDDGRSFSMPIRVPTAGPLRVTLAWTDRPGTPMDRLDDLTPLLRNDLDVRLVHKDSGREYMPYVLDPMNPTAAATRGDNRVDPVEQIYLPGAEAGAYTLVVTAKRALVGGAAQPFSLLVSGAVETEGAVAVDSFDAEAGIDRVDLHWGSSFERSAGTYFIERSTITRDADGRKVYGPATEVGRVDGTGTATTAARYAFSDRHLLAGQYRYRVLFENTEGRTLASELEVNVAPPETFAAISNYPNPFSDETKLVVDLPDARTVRLEVYDLAGRRVAILHDGTLEAGRHEIPIDAGAWAPGVYFARAVSRTGIITHRMVVVR